MYHKDEFCTYNIQEFYVTTSTTQSIEAFLLHSAVCCILRAHLKNITFGSFALIINRAINASEIGVGDFRFYD